MLLTRPLAKSVEHAARSSKVGSNHASALVMFYITLGVVAPFALPLKSTITSNTNESHWIPDLQQQQQLLSSPSSNQTSSSLNNNIIESVFIHHSNLEIVSFFVSSLCSHILSPVLSSIYPSLSFFKQPPSNYSNMRISSSNTTTSTLLDQSVVAITNYSQYCNFMSNFFICKQKEEDSDIDNFTATTTTTTMTDSFSIISLEDHSSSHCMLIRLSINK